MGSDIKDAPNKIGGEIKRTYKRVEDENLREMRDIGNVFDGIGDFFSPDKPEFPEVKTLPPPVESMKLQAEAVRSDMERRRKAAQGRPQSNKQLRPLTQNNKPQLGVRL